MKSKLILLIATSSLLMFAGFSHAENEVYYDTDTGSLVIPKLLFRSESYTVNMQYKGKALFELTSYVKTSVINNFEYCIVAGGTIMEKSPRECSINSESFTEEVGVGTKGEKIIKKFKVEPQPVVCQGAFEQECLVVNGHLFYDNIADFSHTKGYEYILKVEQTQICDPEIGNDCPQDIGIYEYRLIEVISKEKK